MRLQTLSDRVCTGRHVLAACQVSETFIDCVSYMIPFNYQFRPPANVLLAHPVTHSINKLIEYVLQLFWSPSKCIAFTLALCMDIEMDRTGMLLTHLNTLTHVPTDAHSLSMALPMSFLSHVSACSMNSILSISFS
jgi:hypothetical protein